MESQKKLAKQDFLLQNKTAFSNNHNVTLEQEMYLL